jgi:hypothetical protein
MPKEEMALIVVGMDCLSAALFLLMVAWLSSQVISSAWSAVYQCMVAWSTPSVHAHGRVVVVVRG